MFEESDLLYIVKKTITTIIIIVFFSGLFGYIFGFIFEFNMETLYWMTSTIAQLFGAFIAIFLALGFHMIQKIQNNYAQGMEAVNRMGDLQKNVDMQKQMIETYRETQENAQKNIDKLKNDIFQAVITIVFLILYSLIILTFTQSHLKISLPFNYDLNTAISATLFSMIVLSIYSFYHFIKTISKIYDIRYKI